MNMQKFKHLTKKLCKINQLIYNMLNKYHLKSISTWYFQEPFKFEHACLICIII